MEIKHFKNKAKINDKTDESEIHQFFISAISEYSSDRRVFAYSFILETTSTEIDKSDIETINGIFPNDFAITAMIPLTKPQRENI